MSAESPPWPPPVVDQSVRLNSRGGEFRSPLTKHTQRWRKSGARHEFDVQLHMVGPSLESAEAGNSQLARIYAWRAFLAKVQDRALNFYWNNYPQARPANYQSGTGWGTPLVNGAGQLGRSIVVDGLASGAALVAGDVLAFDNGAYREIKTIAGDVTATAGGEATIAITPLINRSPADNANIWLNGHDDDASERAAAEVMLLGNDQAAYTMSGFEVSMNFKCVEALRVSAVSAVGEPFGLLLALTKAA